MAGFVLDSGAAVITEADKARVAREIRTTFATHYARRLTLEQMLEVDVMAEYQKQGSNSKALVLPRTSSAGAKL